MRTGLFPSYFPKEFRCQTSLSGGLLGEEVVADSLDEASKPCDQPIDSCFIGEWRGGRIAA